LGGAKKGFFRPMYQSGMACIVTKLDKKPTANEIKIPTVMAVK
jgi:hypothetical protein